MYEGGQHIIKTVGDYHWNRLSVAQIKALFERYASVVQVIRIDSFLASKFGCDDTHNKGAYTLVINL
jgi:hypothetical protein